MSAYVVDKSTIDALIRAAKIERVDLYLQYCDIDCPADATDSERCDLMGRVLWMENVRSVEYRYPDSHDDLPGPIPPEGITLREIAENYRYDSTYAPYLNAVGVIKAAKCLDYQSCETNDWATTPAKKLLTRIVESVYHKLPGYDDAAWECQRYALDPVAEAKRERENKRLAALFEEAV